MRKKVMTLVIFSSLFLSTMAMAGNSKEDYSWLKPGYEAYILPATGSGQSFTIRMEQWTGKFKDNDGNEVMKTEEGLSLCASVQNSGDGVIPPPGHCNWRITPVGYHLPPEILFEKSSTLSTLAEILKITLASIPLVAEAFNLGVTSEVAQAATNVIAPTPMAVIEANQQVSRSLHNVEHYSQVTADKNTGVTPTAFIPYNFQDMLAALQNRVNKYVKKCLRAPDIIGNYCYDQKYLATMAVNHMSAQNIPEVPAQAGEAGQAELWNSIIAAPNPVNPVK